MSVLWGNSNYWYVLDFYYSYSSCINICIFDVSRLHASNKINTSGKILPITMFSSSFNFYSRYMPCLKRSIYLWLLYIWLPPQCIGNVLWLNLPSSPLKWCNSLMDFHNDEYYLVFMYSFEILFFANRLIISCTFLAMACLLYNKVFQKLKLTVFLIYAFSF